MPALITLIAVLIVAFGYVAIRSFVAAARHGAPPNTRKLNLALGCICIAFVAIAIQGWAHQAVRRGTLSSGVQEWMFTWGVLILGTLTLTVAGVCLWLVTTGFTRAGRDEKLVHVMITSPFVDVKASDLSLTAREVEILEAMAQGHLSDDEIAETFYISPATAATHVRNILRKADLHNRRDLVLLYSAQR